MLPSVEMAERNKGAGIPQVILAMAKYLPENGYELTVNQKEANLHIYHAGDGWDNPIAPDVLIFHGLYPTGENNIPIETWHLEINRRVIHNLKRAKVVICPSQWIADMLRYDMHIDPIVVNWGVHLEQWKNDKEVTYAALWNKNRVEGVCTPEWIVRLAENNPDLHFVSTFGRDDLHNLQLTGTLPHEQMRNLVKQAGVYLATTKETGDIGSREALAAGVPVLGFKHGALPDFVEHGVNGFLAEVGDFDGLNEGLHWCLRNRTKLSENALEKAKDFDWCLIVKEITQYFPTISQDNPIDLSVIIPCYNYAQYVGEAIESVLAQKTKYKFEVIVVDDGSKDHSVEVIEKYPVKLIKQQNQGVAHTRNNGIKAASGRYIACLDADDKMENGWVEVCINALEQDASLGITYTGLKVMGFDHANPFPPQFDYQKQLKRENQVPTLCAFRKEAWEKAGGYRQYLTPAEDADLWTRITTLGYGAKKVTDVPLFAYRMHNNSLSTVVRNGGKSDPFRSPELSYFPSFTANNTVRNYDQPEITIIIPVGDGHQSYLAQALDSVEGQTFPRWECIVINDTGKPLELMGYPYVKILNTKGKKGASHARNLGIKAAKGKFITFLDADDYLHPTFLQKTLTTYRHTGRYVYTDWNMITKDDILESHSSPEFSPDLIFKIGYFHPITCLVPTQDAKELLFDESLIAWEDIDFYMRLIIKGICGTVIKEPLMTYRYLTGTLREWGAARSDTLKELLRIRYNEYIEGNKKVMCGCKNNPKPVAALDMNNGEWVKVFYRGQESAKVNVIGLATRTQYGRRSSGDVMWMLQQDYNAKPDLFEVIQEVEETQKITLVPEDL